MLPPKKRLLDQVRDRLRLKNYAYPPEKWMGVHMFFTRTFCEKPILKQDEG
jgi:hypothetical protein